MRVAALFGIGANRARVALSRMAASGEVVADGAGAYTLTGPLLERAGRLRAARTGATGPGDGSWHVVVITAPPGSPELRRARRAALRTARLGELRDGTWVRPDNLAIELDEPTARAVTRFRAEPEEDPSALAARVFDLAGWARRAETLLAQLHDVGLDDSEALATGFELDAEVLRHLQRDPLLPVALLPATWPGTRLREQFAAFDRRYRAQLARAHRAAAREATVRR